MRLFLGVSLVVLFLWLQAAQRSDERRNPCEGKSRMLPGRCWAFSGSRGHLTIALSHRVTISHVTLGHLPKFLSPTGTIGSSPREFSVYGKRDLEDEGTLLGTFLYDEDGNQLQTFKLPLFHKDWICGVDLQQLSCQQILPSELRISAAPPE